MPSPRGGSFTGGPSLALPKGRETIPAEFKDVWDAAPSPWGRLGWGLYVGMGPLCWIVRTLATL